MIIPIPALWARPTLTSPNSRIDQALDSRTHRLIAGIYVDPNFLFVCGALTISVGHGKFLRLRHAVGVTVNVPKMIGEQCLLLASGKTSDVADYASLTAELAEVQAAVVEKLKCEAGKYVDRVLAVAVDDPGLWTRDFDGRQAYRGFCDATRLAEISGVNVIDSFPARDLAVGGRGTLLDAVPFWLLFADRAERISSRSRFVLVDNEQKSELYFLPASDGLDSELPAIEVKSITKVESIKDFASNVCQLMKSQLRANDLLASPTILDLIVASTLPTESELVQHLRQQLSQATVESVSKMGFSASLLPAVVAALHGLLHVDQMPGNVPWITGAESQRILGRLTPGRPANWRQLIRSMADFQPAAMKLKDAV